MANLCNHTAQSSAHVTVHCDVVHGGCSSTLLPLLPEVQLQSPRAWASLSRTWLANAIVLEPILDVRTRLRALFEVNMRRDQHQCYSRRILACKFGQKSITVARRAFLPVQKAWFRDAIVLEPILDVRTRLRALLKSICAATNTSVTRGAYWHANLAKNRSRQLRVQAGGTHPSTVHCERGLTLWSHSLHA